MMSKFDSRVKREPRVGTGSAGDKNGGGSSGHGGANEIKVKREGKDEKDRAGSVGAADAMQEGDDDDGGGGGDRAVADATGATAGSVDEDKLFVVTTRSFQHMHYSTNYLARLRALRPTLIKTMLASLAQIKRASRSPVRVCSRGISELKRMERTLLLGVVHKQQKKKPRVLDEYDPKKAKLLLALNGLPPKTYVDESDTLMLEDEFGSVRLSGDVVQQHMNTLLTGIVVALIGMEVADGEMVVESFHFAEYAPQPLTLAHFHPEAAAIKVENEGLAVPQLHMPGQNDEFVAFVSGLSFGEPGADRSAATLLAQFLCGQLGDDDDKAMVARLRRLVIAGNSVYRVRKPVTASTVDPKGDAERSRVHMQGQTELIAFLNSLAENTRLHVDLVPGESDPVAETWPQQPFHPCLMKSCTLENLHLRTNPCQITQATESGERVQFLGTAGANVDDAKRCVSDSVTRLQLMDNLLRWRHLAPTAPDTLACLPLKDRDPFVVTQQPHLFFSGNQPELETAFIKGPAGQVTRLLCIPSFAKTATLVIVNLRTLDIEPRNFVVSDTRTGLETDT